MRDCTTLVIIMVNFKKYLQESRDKKFEVIARKKESEPNPYSYYYSPTGGHKYCEHDHCILSDEFREQDEKRTRLENKLREEEEYLRNGEGTVGYDRVSVYKNVLRLKRELEELD